MAAEGVGADESAAGGVLAADGGVRIAVYCASSRRSPSHFRDVAKRLGTALAARGHEVAGADCYLRRDWVAELGSQSATPIRRMTERLQAFRERFDTNLQFVRGDLTDYNYVWNLLRSFQPEAVVHLGEMPMIYSTVDLLYLDLDLDSVFDDYHYLVFSYLRRKELCQDYQLCRLFGSHGVPSARLKGFNAIASVASLLGGYIYHPCVI